MVTLSGGEASLPFLKWVLNDLMSEFIPPSCKDQGIQLTLAVFLFFHFSFAPQGSQERFRIGKRSHMIFQA